MSHEIREGFAGDDFEITTPEGDTIILGTSLDDSDAHVTIHHNGHPAILTTILSDDLIAFVCWMLPPRVHEILADHGVELARVY